MAKSSPQAIWGGVQLACGLDLAILYYSKKSPIKIFSLEGLILE